MAYEPQPNNPAPKAGIPLPADKKAQPAGSQNELDKNLQSGKPKSAGEACGTGACSSAKQSSKPKKDEDEE